MKEDEVLEKLVKKAQAGDKESFVALIELNKFSLTRAARAILHSDSDVADAMQDTVLTAFEKLHTLKQAKYFKTWITRILIYNCCSILRNRRRTMPVENTELIGEGSYIENNDAIIDVQETMKLLSDNDRLILTLYYLDDMAVKDIAKMLVMNENTVKARLSRGRKKFARIYTSKEEISYEA